MKVVHTVVLVIAALCLVATVWWLVLDTNGYYGLPVIERPHHDAHKVFKPGGLVGHGLGIIGSSMVLLLLTYSARKRIKKFRKYGKLSSWLNYHIFLGVAGPILVTFHTAFKFGGLVSIAYWSMVAVALSGFIGRYIYVKIPRRISGTELTMDEIEQRQNDLTKQMISDFNLSSEQLNYLESISAIDDIKQRGLLGIFTFAYHDTIGRITLRAKLMRLGKSMHVDRKKMRLFYDLTIQRIRYARQIAFWSSANKLFHYWHVIHRPFAYTMIVIMIVHTTLAITFGYTWIW